MATTILKFSKICKEDLAIGTGTQEVELSDGRKATLTEINLSTFATNVTNQAIYFTNGSLVGQDSDFLYDTSAKQLTLGDSTSALRIGSTGAASRALHVAGVGDTGVCIDNTDAGAGDAILEFSLHGVVDWNVTADDSDADKLKISAGTTVSSTPNMTFLGGAFPSVAIGTPDAGALNSRGLTIDAVNADGHILDLGDSTQVAHGMTTFGDTFTYGFVSKVASGATGGVNVTGLSSGTIGSRFNGFMTTETTTSSDASDSAVELKAGVKSGTTVAALGATANIVGFLNNTTSVFLVKGDGDVHNSGGATAMSTYDDYDDVKLLQSVKGVMDINYRETLGKWVDEHTRVLERSGVITKSGNGWFISQRGWRGLLIDAFRQLDARLTKLESLGAG